MAGLHAVKIRTKDGKVLDLQKARAWLQEAPLLILDQLSLLDALEAALSIPKPPRGGLYEDGASRMWQTVRQAAGVVEQEPG
jgi:hypothetical protein